MIKRLRFIVQVLFLTLTIGVFISPVFNKSLSDFYYAMHIFPSLSQLVWYTLPPFFLVSIVILLLPLVFGRFYCSFLCPVGFLQDLTGQVAKKLKSIKPRRAAVFAPLGFFVLASSVFLLLYQETFFGYFDHFSNLARLFALGNSSGLSFILSILFLLILTLPTFFFPRFFCAALCPSGAIFGLLKRKALFSVQNTARCKGCGLCAATCPTLCIVKGVVDKAACITCLECTDVCPESTLKYKRHGKKQEYNRDRRAFLKEFSASGAGAFAGVALLSAYDESSATEMIVPPGARGAEHFYARCHSCNICVEHCPTGVLVTNDFDSGILLAGKPRMDYLASYCSYECNVCLAVCPSDAISYLELESRQHVRIGRAEIIKDICIPFDKKRECLACAEHCPSGAIQTEKKDGILIPVLDTDYCIGCGACQKICPVEPKRAVIVKPEKVHTVAFNPRKLSAEPIVIDSKDEDFPF